MCQILNSFSSLPMSLSTLLTRSRNLTQLQISVQDTPLVQVLEARKDLAQVVANLRLQQGVSSLPDVGQGLQKTKVSEPDCLPRSALHLCLLKMTGTQLWMLRARFLLHPCPQ